MKNAVFWDIKPQFIPRMRHITSQLQWQIGQCYVRFDVFMAMTVKNVIFWDIKLVYTSQETHYNSVTEPSRLML
jgi:hypothetical protein